MGKLNRWTHVNVKFFFYFNREREAQLEKQQATKRYIDEFKTAREDWKRAEKAKLEEENRRIKEFADQQRLREQAQQAAKLEMEEAKDRVRAKVRIVIYLDGLMLCKVEVSRY